MSDTACAVGSTGTQVELRPNSLDNSAARAEIARDYVQSGQPRLLPLPEGSKPAYESQECITYRKNAWGDQTGRMQQLARAACYRLMEQERERGRQRRQGNCDYNSEYAADGSRCGMRSSDARPGGRTPP